MRIFRVEHQVIRNKKQNYFVGPWSPEGWRNFPDLNLAFETVLHIGEEIASWEMLEWEGRRVSHFKLSRSEVRGGGFNFNHKYLAGVEREEDLSFLSDWWDFLEMAGFVIRKYEVSEEYLVRAVDFDRNYLHDLGLNYYADQGELGRVNQIAFHRHHAKLIS